MRKGIKREYQRGRKGEGSFPSCRLEDCNIFLSVEEKGKSRMAGPDGEGGTGEKKGKFIEKRMKREGEKECPSQIVVKLGAMLRVKTACAVVKQQGVEKLETKWRGRKKSLLR